MSETNPNTPRTEGGVVPYDINEELKELINQEKYSEYPNPEQMQFFENLKIVLDNFPIFFETRQWTGFVSNTLKNIYIETANSKVEGLISIVNELLVFENDSLRFVGDFEKHIIKVDDLITEQQLDDIVKFFILI